MKTSLTLRHFLLAVAVVAVWGSNFVVIKLALGHMPPLLFVAMNGPISPGLASLVIQVQVFFTIGLAMAMAGETLQRVQWFALALAGAGLAVIVTHTDGSTTLLGLGLILLAALSWAGGNLVSRQAGRINMVAYVVWSSLFAVPPLAALSLWVEGWPALARGFESADAFTWAAVAWQAWGNSIFGYAAWGWLLSRYSAATITPMALLVPLFGMGSSAWWLRESLPGWKIGAAALVMGGLALNLLWPWWVRKGRAA